MKFILFFLPLLISLPLFAYDKQIIGSDDRRQIDRADDAYHRTVGMIEYEGRSNTYCTGTLISRRHIITNAHCVVANREIPAMLLAPEVISFSPGRLARDHLPGGSFRGVAIHVFDEWIQTRSGEWDVAVVELEREVMEPQIKLKPFTWGDLPLRSELWISAYSAGKPYGSMWEGPGQFLQVLSNGQQFHHTIDTQPGTSGALIRYRSRGEWVGLGVHRGTAWPVLNVNAGILFNQRVYNAVTKWLKK